MVAGGGQRGLIAALAGARLTAAALAGARLTAVALAGARLTAVALAGARLSAVALAGARLSAAALAGARLSAAALAGARLTAVALAGARLTAVALAGARLNFGALAALSVSQSVGILREINIVVEVRHYRDQAADGNGNTVTRVVGGVGASGNREVETGRHGTQRDDRGLVQNGHEDSLPRRQRPTGRPCETPPVY
jgi:Pentapeptide repeats (8 copies)